MKNTRSLLFRFAALLMLYLWVALGSNAQELQSAQKSVSLAQPGVIQEKIFVHTDKSVYLPGEMIWLKIYCVNADTHRPLNLSKVVYVDILDHNQIPVVQEKISMKDGLGNGSVYVPVAVNNDNYTLRAYTNWMKNFSADFFFQKRIKFVNPLKTPPAIARTSSPAYDVQFFPEGGNLVSGITSKVGFKAVDRAGKGVTVSGAILGERNDTVARFKSLTHGMGSFMFTPAANVAYRAVIRVGAEKPFGAPLPAVMNQGYVMQLTDDRSGKLDITVKSRNVADDAVYLFVHNRQAIKVAKSSILTSGAAHFIIPKDSLSEGVSHITLFNAARQPVCERLFFKRPQQQLLINARADKPQYAQRKKVTVGFTVKDQANKLSGTSLSMAVYRVDSLQSVDPANIVNCLWLTSELKGTVESPDDYFTANTPEAAEALDNLMLTQGWRKFQWKPWPESSKPKFNYLPEYTGHIISAHVINTATNAPAGNIITYLGIPGKRVQLYTSQSDSTGHVLYNTKEFWGPNEIVLQTNSLVDSTYRIDVESPFYTQPTAVEPAAFTLSPNAMAALREHNLSTQVLNVYSGNAIRRFYAPRIDSTAFFGKPANSYKLDDFTRFTTMEEVLREYVKEDNIRISRGRYRIKVLTKPGLFLEGDPLVLLDGIPMFDINKVMAIDPLKIRTLDVLPAEYYYGTSQESGIFSFTTYKGDLAGIDIDPRAIVLDYEGLQLHREFFSPVYDTEAQAASRIPDYRNVLYWSPELNTTGKGEVSFYTSDQAGKYIGVIQGITTGGNAGAQSFTFEVK